MPPQHSGKLHSTPKLVDLMNLVAAVIPGKWREVALGLGLDSADISRIEASVPTHNPTPCYIDVFDTWKNKGTEDYTWDTLLKALRTSLVGESKLASTIEGQIQSIAHDSNLTSCMVVTGAHILKWWHVIFKTLFTLKFITVKIYLVRLGSPGLSV